MSLRFAPLHAPPDVDKVRVVGGADLLHPLHAVARAARAVTVELVDRVVQRGHAVVLHARDDQRARDALAELPQAEHVVVGDLETIAGAIAVPNTTDIVSSGGRIYKTAMTAGTTLAYAVMPLALFSITSTSTALVRTSDSAMFSASSPQSGCETRRLERSHPSFLA